MDTDEEEQKKRLYRKEYYQKNKQKIKEYQKEYYEKFLKVKQEERTDRVYYWKGYKPDPVIKITRLSEPVILHFE